MAQFNCLWKILLTEHCPPTTWQVAPKPNTFLAFGSGTHSCPGNELAKLEILVLLHHLTTKYRLVSRNHHIPSHRFPFPLFPEDWPLQIGQLFTIFSQRTVAEHLLTSFVARLQVVVDGSSGRNPVRAFCSSPEWPANPTVPEIIKTPAPATARHLERGMSY